MADYNRSSFAPDRFPDLPPIRGFDMAVSAAGIRYQGRTDLWVLRGAPGTTVAGVFTQNKLPGAPVDWSRKALENTAHDGPQLVVVNSGTANVFTGQRGRDAVIQTAAAAAAHFGGTPNSVQIASTGVIGEVLDVSKVSAAFPDMAANMSASWEDAARAIMTTDTFAKGATATAVIDGQTVTLNGIAKGSGMIAPDMATMLAYIATDAAITQPVLQALLSELTEPTFNAVSVDSDTSTSDTLLLLASGAADHAIISEGNDPRLGAFKAALHSVMHSLSQHIIRDGEGLTKVFEVRITGAKSDESARIIAKSVANSPLVKTAIAGEDANWGRIIMAVGKCGQPADRDSLSIAFGPHIVAENGGVSDQYSEDATTEYMRGAELVLSVDVGIGEGRATVWGCDLTHGYIDINADYRS